MPRWLQYTFAATIALLLVVAPLTYARYRHNRLRNFHIVRPGVLYRSGQLSRAGLARVIYDHGIKTVVTLRSGHLPGEPAPDLAEEEYCDREQIKYFRLPQQPWEAPDGSVPNEINVIKFREIMADPANYPVLVHCLAGKHRTGAMCAVFRMEHDHWTNQQALDELRFIGFDKLDETPDVLGYLESYRPAWVQATSLSTPSHSPHSYLEAQKQFVPLDYLPKAPVPRR
jgi:tyrosine-protein phosphatase SIW14